MILDTEKDIIIYEVGPRDGLQNEPQFVSTSTKIELINQLAQSGLKNIEVTSFVNPQKIPQMADHSDVYQGITKFPGINYSALIPNLKGMEAAIQAGVKQIAIFTAASETFNQRNINCSIEDSLERFKPVVEVAHAHQITIRAYISCALGCPYEGNIPPENVLALARRLHEFNINEISFGDTIGVGTPKQTQALLTALKQELSTDFLCMHFHDTYGQAVANVYAALEMGIYKFDSAVAGLGGCPYARGASGNLATEDLLYLLHGMGLKTGVDIFKIVQIGGNICHKLNRPNQSKVGRALLAKP